MALWTPAQLEMGLALWLDADDASTITLNGTDVAAWADKSGNGYDVSQGTAANQPAYVTNALNGKPVIRTDGGDQMENTTSSLFRNVGVATWVAVAKYPVATGGDSAMLMFCSTGVDALRARFGLTANPSPGGAFMGVAGRRLDTDSFQTAASSTPRIVNTGFLEVGQANYANAKANHWTNGTQDLTGATFQTAGNTSNTNPLTLNVFGSAPTGTEIAEVIAIEGPLPDYEREKLEGYLAHKWGVADDLPAAHPYKSAAPTVDDPAAVSNWTPANITGLWSWHDWSTDDYRINDNKGSVSGWQDRSSNSHDLTLQTISLGVADMVATTINGVQAYGSINGQQGWTVAKLTTELDTDFLLVGMVAKMPTAGTNDFFVSTRDDAGIAWQIFNPNSSLLTVGIAGTGTFPSYTIGTGNAFILVVRYDLRVSGTTPLATPGFMVKSRLNGDLTDDRDANTITSYNPSNVRVGIGCQPAAPNIVSCPVNAAFGEVVIASRNTEFTVADVQRLEGYLAWKWGGL